MGLPLYVARLLFILSACEDCMCLFLIDVGLFVRACLLVLRTQFSCVCLCCNAAFRVTCVYWLHVCFVFVLLACLCLHVCFECDRVCVCFCMLRSCISYHMILDYRCVFAFACWSVFLCLCACFASDCVCVCLCVLQCCVSLYTCV